MPQFRIPVRCAGCPTARSPWRSRRATSSRRSRRWTPAIPGFKDRLLDDKGELRQFVNVYLNDEDVRLGPGLKAKVGEKDEISIVPAVAGGAFQL